VAANAIEAQHVNTKTIAAARFTSSYGLQLVIALLRFPGLTARKDPVGTILPKRICLRLTHTRSVAGFALVR
jgi:hypothetical protein